MFNLLNTRKKKKGDIITCNREMLRLTHFKIIFKVKKSILLKLNFMFEEKEYGCYSAITC